MTVNARPRTSPCPRTIGMGLPSPADTRRPDLSVIIVSWNTRELLRACLRSIHQWSGGLDLEVIVIDNASVDGSAAMVTEAFPDVRLIDNTENAGFAAGNNQGLAEAGGRYVLLLNPDTVILDDVLREAIAFAEAHRDVGVVGCQVLESETTVQRTCFRFPSVTNTLLWVTGLSAAAPRSTVAGRAAYGPWARDCERDVDVVSGMFMLVRREALDEVGSMDDRFFVFGEEADWCRRFWTAGWRCVFAPVGRILHVEGGNKSTDQARLLMYLQLQKGILLFHRKHHRRLGYALARALFATFMPLRAAWWTLRAGFTADAETRRRARFAAAATRFHWTGKEPG